ICCRGVYGPETTKRELPLINRPSSHRTTRVVGGSSEWSVTGELAIPHDARLDVPLPATIVAPPRFRLHPQGDAIRQDTSELEAGFDARPAVLTPVGFCLRVHQHPRRPSDCVNQRGRHEEKVNIGTSRVT